MAHPKRRQSKTRTAKRRTHDKAVAPTLAICPNCGEFLQQEVESEYFGRLYVCPKCNHTAKIPPCSHVDKRYCNILDENVWTVNCQNCKSKEYCQYNKKEN